MFALAHPAMLRQMHFSVIDSEEDSGVIHKGWGKGSSYGTGYSDKQYTGWGYGAVAEDLDGYGENCIVLEELGNLPNWDEKFSVRWIEDQIVKIEQGSI